MEAKTWLQQTVGSMEQQYKNQTGERHQKFLEVTADAQNSETCQTLFTKFPLIFTEDSAV